MIGTDVTPATENELTEYEAELEDEINHFISPNTKDEIELKLKLYDIQSRNYMYGLILERLDKIGSKIL